MFERNLTRREMELIEDIREFIKEKHSQSERHDYSHVLQVVRYAIQIAKAIPDEVNPFVLICGALFHDVGWIGTDTGVLHGLRGATIVDEYFDSTWVSADVKKRIKRIVIRHTATSMMAPQTVEEKIVWDADGLDGMGLIGILRGLVAEQGSIEEILTDEFRESRKTYDRLYFEESRRIGKELHEETIEVIRSFKRALDHRLKAIEQLALPVERPVNWARVWVDISQAK
ncbi:MAG TPA: HD domain-containing protein [Anaerolineae bacterium]|nr:HD domain-containing protein [Anaerolineae bacterium]